MNLRSLTCHAALLASALICFSCEKETPSVSAPIADAGTKTAVDPALARAMASAAAAAPKAPGAAQGGPPPTGVFEPGQADREFPRNAAARLVLGSEGSEPRVRLSALTNKPNKRNGTLEINMQMGMGQRLPPVELSLTSNIGKPAEAAASASGAAGASSGVAGAAPVVVNVTAAKVGMLPGMQVPEELAKEVAKLKGSKLEYQLLPSGAATELRYELAKGADPGFDNVVRAALSVLTAQLAPLPDKPVGVGAYWMVTSRDESAGFDAIAYRMYKLEAIEGDQVRVTLTTKRYATGSDFDFSGLKAEGKLTLQELAFSGEGTLSLRANEATLPRTELTESMNAVLIRDANAGQRASIQLITRAVYEPRL